MRLIYIFLIISHSVLLRMRNISDKFYRENQNTDLYSIIFCFRKSCGSEIMWKNIVGPGRSQMTERRIHVACWIPKAKNTLTEYVLLTDFLLQQSMHERASILRHT